MSWTNARIFARALAIRTLDREVNLQESCNNIALHLHRTTIYNSRCWRCRCPQLKPYPAEEVTYGRAPSHDVPQLFWIRAFRRNIITVYFVAMCVNVGMWYERFAIIAASRFFAFQLANVLSDLGRCLHLRRYDWPFPHAVSLIHQVLPNGRDVRGEERTSGG